MASILLRSSTLHRVLSAAAVAAPAAEAGLAARRAVPLRRLFKSGAADIQPRRSLDDKVNSLHRSIKELDYKVDKRFLIYASLQKLVEKQKLLNPFVQWSWQVGVVTLIVFAEHWPESVNRPNLAF